MHSSSEDVIDINVATMNVESLKAWINCSRKLFKSAFTAWKDRCARLPTRFGKSLVFVISRHFDICMQGQRFVIHSLRFWGFFLERSIILPQFYRTSPRASEVRRKLPMQNWCQFLQIIHARLFNFTAPCTSLNSGFSNNDQHFRFYVFAPKHRIDSSYVCLTFCKLPHEPQYQ